MHRIHSNILKAIMGGMILCYLCAHAHGVDFAGGTGEPNDPYQIATAAQLLAMDDDPNLYDNHFILMADIDLSPDLPGGKVFSGPVLRPWGISTGSRGGRGTPFAGSFDGNGHAIRNFVLYNMSSSLYAGLFDSVGPSARIRNLHLEDVVIGGRADSGGYCGTLVGRNEGFVVNCSATGTILADAMEWSPSPGGLIGNNSGFIVDCHAECYVFGGQIGGLVGENEETGRIVLCSSNGIAIGDETTGGLVGTNAGMVQYSCAGGNVLGNRPGGLVGSNDGMVRACYAEGNVSGNWSVGGIAASNSGQVVDCYVTGSVSGDGLVGTNEGTVASSYSTTGSQVAPPSRRTRRSLGIESMPPVEDPVLAHLGSISGMTVTAAAWPVSHVYYLEPNKPEDWTGDSYSSTYGVPLSPAEMEQQVSFVGLDFHGDPNDGAQDPWFMPESGYPILTWQTEITGLAGIPDVSGLTLKQAQELLTLTGFVPDAVSYDYARPHEVCDWRKCQWISTEGEVLHTTPSRHAPPSSSVEIAVSLGPYDFDDNPGDGSETNPYRIATPGQFDDLHDGEDLWASHFILTADIDLAWKTYARSLVEQFSGTFDGNGHTVRYRGRNGLFGTIEPNGIVCNLVIEQAAIIAEAEAEMIGMLANRSEGQIRHCVASGRILGGRSYIGGLVGNNGGQITDCRVRGQILPETTASYIGGLAGQNTQSIVGSCAVETVVSGDTYVGGLVGMNYGSEARVESSYAHSDVRGTDYVGGLVGANAGRPFRSSRTVMAAGDPVAVVRNCYTTCSVTGQGQVGGAIGWAPDSALHENCYFLDPDDGGGPDNGYGTPLSDSTMRQQASFVGWDFDAVWMICAGKDYPRLQWEGIRCED